MRSLSRLVTFALAMVPILMLAFVVGTTLVQSREAVATLGIGKLFGPVLASRFVAPGKETYGLLAPLWGTVVVALLALGLGLPSSLSLALLVREYPLGPFSRLLGGILGLLSGIPPIVYATTAVYVGEAFMRPKFAGWELTDIQIKASIMGLPQYNPILVPVGMPNSTLLGGVLLALLIVPFMTPLIEDAIRNVPEELRIGSYALGAGRWYTLTRIVLPQALPGMVSAVTMGLLKALGEVTIAYFAIGTVTRVVVMPVPLWDALEKVPTLSSAGAGLMGGFGSETEGSSTLAFSVAYFAGFLLLIMALGVMALMAWLEKLLRKRMAS